MGEYCYFQAGVAGQRAGVTVVTLGDNEHIRTPETVRTLAIHVLPKIWSPNGRRNIIEPLPADRPHPTHLLDETGCLHVYLYEREILKLPADWQQPFSAVVGSGNEPAESNRREDTPYVDLWNAPAWEPHTRDADFTIGRVIRPGSDEEFTPVRQFWRILEHYHQAPVEDATSRTVPPQGLGIFSRIDWLQEPTYRKFLNLCKNALEHRRPRFESETDELGFVRGRMVLDKLIDRQATHRTGVVCEFDSLTTDIHLWQVIRAGLQRVAMQAKDAQLRQQALGYEATLRDVSVHNAQTLLNERLSPTFMARIPDEQALAYRYARAIIAQQFGFGFDTDPYEAGVITNIKYDTSILWETMLEKALLQALPEGMYTLNTLPKFSYIRRPATNSAVLKRPAEIRPGFVVRTADTGAPVCVLEANYDPIPRSFEHVRERDFNRILQYAYRVGCHAHLLFPDTRVHNGPVDIVYTGSPTGEDFHLGIFGVQFPDPIDSSITLDVSHIVHGILQNS